MRLKSNSSTPKKLRTEIAASLKLEADGAGESDDVAVIDEEGAEGEEQFAGGDGGSYQVHTRTFAQSQTDRWIDTFTDTHTHAHTQTDARLLN